MPERYTLPLITKVSDGIPFAPFGARQDQPAVTLMLETKNGDVYEVPLTGPAAAKVGRLLSQL